MAKIFISIDVDLDELPRLTHEVVSKAIALQAAKGTLVDSNFNLPITKVGPWRIESGSIRRVY